MMGQAHLTQLAKAAFKLDGEPAVRPGPGGGGPWSRLLAGGGRLARLAKWLSSRVSWSGKAAARGERALQILEKGDHIRRITPHHHLVRSQMDSSIWYDVRQEGSRWSCSCADHLYRKAQCKHILAVMAQVAEKEAAALGSAPEPAGQSEPTEPTEPTEPAGQSDVHLHPVDRDRPGRCPKCKRPDPIKWGRVYASKDKTQRYRCGRCGHTFVYRGGFERMRRPDWAILDALDHFFKGHSPGAIADTLKKKGCPVHPATIYRWIVKFIRWAHAYLRTLPVRTGERFGADEVFGAAGRGSCLFSVTDLQTRFCLAHEMADRKDGHNATALLESARDRAGKVPSEFVSDGLPSYQQAHQIVFAARTPLDKCSVHVGEAAIRNKKRNNNVQERFNGTFRAFQRPRRGIKKPDSPLIDGFFTHYNFVRPHMALGGRTPAEAAGITIHGPDKWRTIIGNAALGAAP